MTLGGQPDWIKGIRRRLDYRWRYQDERGILPDNTIYLDGTREFLDTIAAGKEMDSFSSVACFQCGTCSTVCPYGLFEGITGKISVRKMVHRAQLGTTIFGDGEIWTCTTCNNCAESCPRGVGTIELIKNLRRITVEESVGYFPDSIRTAVLNTAGTGNPFGEVREKGIDWADGLDIPLYSAENEFLFFPGCYPSYDPRARKTARAMAAVLKKAGVNFGILRENGCCGESIRKTGNEEVFLSLAANNIDIFNNNQVRRMVVMSPHCYHTFRNEYPSLGSGVEVVHYTQYLARLIRDGRLRFNKELHLGITYQDSCYLGRHNGIYDEPREILESIPGVNLVEMPLSRERSLCCGGGGGGIWMDTRKGERLSDLRLEQVVETGADILAVACPYCLVNFEDGTLSSEPEINIRVRDISELVLEVI